MLALQAKNPGVWRPGYEANASMLFDTEGRVTPIMLHKGKCQYPSSVLSHP